MNKDRRIVAVLGISGVGKTTAINRYIEKNPEWIHIEAGKLLNKALPDVAYDDLQRLDTKKILENQRLIIQEFKNEITQYKEGNVIFNAHAVIEHEKELIFLPYEVFSDIGVTEMLHITVNPDVIWEQKQSDKSRSRIDLTISDISKVQDLSVEHAKKCAKKLGISYHIIERDELSKFLES